MRCVPWAVTDRNLARERNEGEHQLKSGLLSIAAFYEGDGRYAGPGHLGDQREGFRIVRVDFQVTDVGDEMRGRGKNLDKLGRLQVAVELDGIE
jgi:hypothetical protein